ncbi:MAG: radical SAM protein [Bdellovibrionaceae bacterium]|nr:radical SAM protein [Pseudobdellovibrionaceae bacterium]MDW8190780.1 radical SAM protein [Pseudobdellovibrionaceae bacterium]
MTLIKINEIFFSIQGESTRMGLPTIFIRTSGCPLRCSYCDTQYAYYEGKFQDIDEIIDSIKSYQTQYVCITGGEPLAQKGTLLLMKRLCDLGYLVSLETSGAKSIASVDPRVKIILDVKTPGSGEGHTFLMENLSCLREDTEIKFVIADQNDVDWSIRFCEDNALFGKYVILFSPSFGVISPRWLAEQILKKSLPIRLQIQLHKYIWNPSQRGV